MKLLEASLTKLLRDINKNQQFAIITAWRAAQKRKENKGNLKNLIGDIKNKGLSFIRIQGHGQEEDEEGNIHQVKEPSLIVKNMGTSGKMVMEPTKFDHFMLDLGKKFGQWGLVLKNAKDQMELIKVADGKPEIEAKFSKVAVNKVADFFSTLKGKKFVLEYYSPDWTKVMNWIEGFGLETKWRKEINEIILESEQERI